MTQPHHDTHHFQNHNSFKYVPLLKMDEMWFNQRHNALFYVFNQYFMFLITNNKNLQDLAKKQQWHAIQI